MRLLDTQTLELDEFQGEAIPGYAILSHTWGDEEVSFQLLSKPEAKSLAGYSKIVACCNLAAAQGWKYVWIDTCCIDKTSSAELSEAINSMWRWYENSEVCLVYLQDYTYHPGNGSLPEPPDFARRRWSTRGWTLQELLAPKNVVFYDSSWTKVGTRSDLGYPLSIATGISRLHLRFPKIASSAAKMSWMSKRQTTRSEDMAYSLLGLFDVYMPLIYGEGSNAFMRLQQEIIKSSNDETIFAWTDDSLLESGMFALSPAAFVNSGDVVMFQHSGIRRTPYSLTNFGLAIEVEREALYKGSDTTNRGAMPLACTKSNKRVPLTITLLFTTRGCVRTDVGKLEEMDRSINPYLRDYQLIYIPFSYRHKSDDWREPPLELRWNRDLEEQLRFEPFSAVGGVMNQSGVIYSNYTDENMAVKLKCKEELINIDRRVRNNGHVPYLQLDWMLKAGESSISATIFISKDGRVIGNQCQSYRLRTGGEITVPLWNDLHLRIDCGRETFDGESLFIDLKLIVSTRDKIFPSLK